MTAEAQTKVALLQTASPAAEAREARIARVLDEARRAAATADLVVLPELWATGFFAFDRYSDEASDLESTPLPELAEIARASGCHVAAGSVLERSGEAIHNTAVLFRPTGVVALTYRKAHVFGLAGSDEARLVTPGSRTAVARLPWGVVGMMTCYDLRFPELARALVEQGAEVLLVTAAWPMVRREHWRLLLRARAVENQTYVIACNAAGDSGGAQMAGHSAVIDPTGEVIAEACDAPTTLEATIEISAVTKVRTSFPVLDDRRPFLTGPWHG